MGPQPWAAGGEVGIPAFPGKQPASQTDGMGRVYLFHQLLISPKQRLLLFNPLHILEKEIEAEK